MKVKIPKFLKVLFWPFKIFIVKPLIFIFRPLFRLLYKPIKSIYEAIMVRVRKSIRAELVVTFGACLLAAMFISSITNSYFKKNNKIASIDYSSGMSRIANESTDMVSEIINQKYSIDDKVKIEQMIVNRTRYNDNTKILIVDLDGKVIYKSKNSNEAQVDLYSLIKNAMELRQGYSIDGENGDRVSSSRNEYISFYPVSFSDSRAYIITSGIPEGTIVYRDRGGNSFLSFLVGCTSFIFLFLYGTRNKMKYIEEIAKGLGQISKGNLDYRVEKIGQDELALLADNINSMAEELKDNIDAERRAEKTKNELITNVSHDLRTPLTSIMGYLGLIKDKKYENEEELKEYLNIAYNKSEKLKVLMEDLFEYTKLTNEGIKLNKQEIAFNEFLDQLVEELIPLCEENDMQIIKKLHQQQVYTKIDTDKILRVFENLIVNAIKYSYKPGEIHIELKSEGDEVIVSIHNKGDNIPEEELNKLFDRFYRADKSRSQQNGGSGLGLAIAKNIVELHQGSIWAECEGNDIYFFVKLITSEVDTLD